jgi:hypothetical protein
LDLPFTPRHVSLLTASHAFPLNPLPSVPFTPTTIRDLLLDSDLIIIVELTRQSWQYITDCERLGISAEQGRIRTLAAPVEELLVLAAQGAIWECRRNPPVPADFSVAIESYLNLTHLQVSLANYPDQELVSFITKVVSL